jgi:predicted DNA-binding transcriptional regulator AlpA
MAITGRPPDKQLLTAEEAAAMMGIKERQFLSLVSRHKFPPAIWFEEIRARRWLVKDVEAYLHLRSRMGPRPTAEQNSEKS